MSTRDPDWTRGTSCDANWPDQPNVAEMPAGLVVGVSTAGVLGLIASSAGRYVIGTYQ